MIARRRFLAGAALALLVPRAGRAHQAGTGQHEAPRPEGREAPSLAGRLLVATEDVRDPRFRRTVIYMLHHDATGAMGLVLNRPLGDGPLAELLERLGRDSEGVAGTIRVHYGGPVEPGNGFVLHTADWTGRESRVIRAGVAFSRDPAILVAIARGTGPRRFLFALGHAGWSPGQLEAEIEREAWITVLADEALVFDADTGRKWERAMALRPIPL